ncbi:MAG: TauD/TfdA family dioxygenase [Pseudomonadota bacterium]
MVGPLGADVWGVDLESLTDGEFEDIYAAWLEHDGVLRLPGQFVPVEVMLDFAARFGVLDDAPITSKGHAKSFRPDLPKLAVISNIVEDGKPLGSLGSLESAWHTDMSYNDVPPKASILQGVELPRMGGATGYANMYTVLDTLPSDLRASLEGLTCKHDASRDSVGIVRRGFEEAYGDRSDVPGAVHPLVVKHPETGRDCLYLGRRALAHIPELSSQDSDQLLDLLWAHASQERFAWYQHWRQGDIVVWDNRCTMHRRDALDPSERRLLYRAQIQGERPSAADQAA